MLTTQEDIRGNSMKRTLALAAITCLALFSLVNSAGGEEPAELHERIAKLDAEFFGAFNTCDLKKVAEMFHEELEFFHDISGLAGREQSVQSLTSLCDRKLGLERTLVEGSLEVYPIPNYGAIQKGEHTFCHMENGKNDCGTFGFVHIWKDTENGWKMTRVVSYGH